MLHIEGQGQGQGQGKGKVEGLGPLDARGPGAVVPGAVRGAWGRGSRPKSNGPPPLLWPVGFLWGGPQGLVGGV